MVTEQWRHTVVWWDNATDCTSALPDVGILDGRECQDVLNLYMVMEN